MESLLMEEQEVHVSFGRLDKFATVYVSDEIWMSKFDKMCKEIPTLYSCIGVSKLKDGSVVGKTYKFPKNKISFDKN